MQFIKYLILCLFISAFSYAAENCDYHYLSPEVQAKLEEIKSKWPDKEKELYFNSYIDSTFMYERFFNSKDLEAASKVGTHPLDLYGNALKQYQSFKTGSTFLNKIPKGEFVLSEDLIKNLHKIVMEGVYRVDEKIAATLLPIFVAKPGKYKTLKNFGFSPFTKHHLNEKQFQAIKDNPDLGFLEVPFVSKADHRVGFIVFPSGRKAKKELQDLIVWYNENKATMHPILLAAKFQRKFISMHPFYNGNGRVSRLIMDRILAEGGYPPSIISDMNMDLYVSEKEWIDEVSNGILKSDELMDNSFDSWQRTPKISDSQTGAFPKLVKHKDNPYLNDSIFPGRENSEVVIKGDHLVLFQDGFFYSNKGIPYIMKDKSFYPVADYTYMLYGQNGNIIKDSYGAERFQGGKRNSPKFAQQVFKDHIKFLDKLKKNEINLGEYQILPYSLIEKANNTSQFHLYDWQKEVFEHAITIKEKNALAILSPNGTQLTTFDHYFNSGSSPTMSDVLGQYQKMDLLFASYVRFAEKNCPELMDKIQESRQKLFSAGKTIFSKYQEQLTKLSADELKLIEKSADYKLLNDYLDYTPLKYNTLEEADAALGDSIYLIRSDADFATKIGFLSEKKMHDIIEGLPFSDKLVAYIKQKAKAKAERNTAADVWTNDELSQFSNRILDNPYRYKGVDPEYQRSVVDMVNHAINFAIKRYTSFSTSTGLYAGALNGNSAIFTSISTRPYNVYFVKFKKENALDNITSMFSSEYEVLVEKYTLPTQIKKTIDPKTYVNFKTEEMKPEELEIYQKYLSNIMRFDMKDLEIP